MFVSPTASQPPLAGSSFEFLARRSFQQWHDKDVWLDGDQSRDALTVRNMGRCSDEGQDALIHVMVRVGR